MGRRWGLRAGALTVALTAIAAGCGDDDDDDAAGGGGQTAESSTTTVPETGGASTTTETSDAGGAATTTTAAEDEEPQRGGEMTVLFYNEQRTMDPIRATTSGGSDAQQIFAFYGALLTMDPATVELTPLLAESFEPNDDFTVWTLTLRDGITFSDGTPYDAQAVMDYWTRIQDPASASPAVSTAGTIASMTVVDPQTLEVTLAAPNAHFDRAVERQCLNYVPSAEAARAGHDFTNDPIGAGPWLMEEWVRDDHMSMVPNPDWVGSDGPYLDRYTIRTLYDEEQRSNTFISGDGQMNFTNSIASTIQAGEDAGASWNFVSTPSSPAYTFNNQAPPFDDVRVRRAFIQAVDHDTLIEVAGLLNPTTHWIYEESPWYEPEAVLPEFDAVAAQELFNEVAAEQGGPVQIDVGAFQQSNDQLRAEFLQTTLNQFENVEATVTVLAAPEATQRVLQRNYQQHSWGYPFIDPEPNLFNYAHSDVFTNFSGYSNPEVDEALEAARATRDFDERKELYSQVFIQLAEDVPWWSYSISEAGFLAMPEVQGLELYHEYVVRSDLLWLEQ